MAEVADEVAGLAPGSRAGTYIVQRKLGEGGMAAVYLAKHEVLGSLHAIKVLAPELLGAAAMRERFLAEGKIQASVRHPNVVPVTGMISEPGVAALVMDYIDGPSLEAFLQQRGALPWQEAVAIISSVIAGVDCAHAQRVVHRDLKPSNVLMEPQRDGTWLPKVCDFGIAKLTDSSKGLTRTGARMGTPQYMSPEQVRDSAHVDQRSDIWAIGAILFELLTGQCAFDGSSGFDIELNVVRGARSQLPGHLRIPAGLDAIVSRALQVDPDARFPDCTAMARALKALSSEPTLAVQPAPVHGTRPLPGAESVQHVTGEQQRSPSGSSLGKRAMGIVALVIAFGVVRSWLSSDPTESSSSGQTSAMVPNARVSPAQNPPAATVVSDRAPPAQPRTRARDSAARRADATPLRSASPGKVRAVDNPHRAHGQGERPAAPDPEPEPAAKPASQVSCVAFCAQKCITDESCTKTCLANEECKHAHHSTDVR